MAGTDNLYIEVNAGAAALGLYWAGGHEKKIQDGKKGK
jgi:hypothetical protein